MNLDIVDSYRQDEPVLGERLRSIRQERGLSVRALAKRSGFSASFLSQVELGQSSPSLASLQKIADTLEIGLPDLLAKGTKGSTILRRTRRETVRSEWSKASVELLVPAGTDDRLSATLVKLDPAGKTGTIEYGSGERFFAYCVRGNIHLQIGPSEDEQRVNAGDSILLDGPRALSWENRSKKPAELFVVNVRFSAEPRRRRG